MKFKPKIEVKPQLSIIKKQLLQLFYQGLNYQTASSKQGSSRLKEQAVSKTQQLEKEFALAEIATEEEGKETLQRLGLRIMGEFVSLNPLNYQLQEEENSLFKQNPDITQRYSCKEILQLYKVQPCLQNPLELTPILQVPAENTRFLESLVKE